VKGTYEHLEKGANMGTLKRILKLSPLENKRWKELETIVIQGRNTFYAVAAAWVEIRDKKYYQAAGWDTLEEYAHHLGYTSRHLYQMCLNAKTVLQLPKNLQPYVLNANAARALARLTKMQQASVMEQLSEGGTKAVTAKAIKEIMPPKQKREMPPPTEADFYKPFAEWLIKMKESSKAKDLGGNRLTDKWATPDVVGTTPTPRDDISKFPIQIVAAEIKVDRSQLVPGFGQACAYRLFAHKSYLVIPNNTCEDERERIETLCQMFGIGLITFNADDRKKPDFQRRKKPETQQPILSYYNKYIKCFGDVELFS
jgi:hypothetical protein